jgi:V8-like Glu-specific endopeptidase
MSGSPLRLLGIITATATAAAAAAGCTDEPSPSRSPFASDPRIETLIAAGSLELDLALAVAQPGAAPDPTVLADVRDLVTRTLDQVGGLDVGGSHRLALRYLGKGRLGASPEARARSATAGAPGDAPALTGFDAFNPATRNEFRIELGGDALEAIGRSAAVRGLDTGALTAASAIERPISESWSNGDDDRYRPYGINAAVTNSAHRMLVRLGSGCSGTLVGPRHIVTAGHCLYDRDDDTWSDDFWARAGRNGTSNAAQVFIDNDNIPGGQVLWYFTPAQYRAESGSTWGYDYGILVVPARIGDTTGWMGRVTYSSASLASATILRRGYPVCDHATRTDEPEDCEPHHLYANAAACEVGEYESVDADGWSRIIHHSCDASAGDSGSSLYVYHNDVPSVTAVHFFSHCETSPTDDECTGTRIDRPLGAIRLTPEYRDWIGYFRDLFP